MKVSQIRNNNLIRLGPKHNVVGVKISRVNSKILQLSNRLSKVFSQSSIKIVSRISRGFTQLHQEYPSKSICNFFNNLFLEMAPKDGGTYFTKRKRNIFNNFNYTFMLSMFENIFSLTHTVHIMLTESIQ